MSWFNAEHFCYMCPRCCVYGFPKVVRSNTGIVLWIIPQLSSTFCLVHYLLIMQRFMKRHTLFNDTGSSSLPPNLIYGVYQLSVLYIVRLLVCSRLFLVYFFLWLFSPTAHTFFFIAAPVWLFYIGSSVTVIALFCRCHAFAVLCCVLLHWLDSKSLLNICYIRIILQ